MANSPGNIDDPIAINFANTLLRPMCERARALSAMINAMQNEWFGGVNALFPNDTTPVVDNRQSQGVVQLTGADVNSAMSNLIACMNALNAQVIQKPCVQALAAQ